jgi:hypothetical protein
LFRPLFDCLPLFACLSLADFLLKPRSTKTGWILRDGFGLMRLISLSSGARNILVSDCDSETSSWFRRTWKLLIYFLVKNVGPCTIG